MELKENISKLIEIRSHYDELVFQGGNESQRLSFLQHCKQCTNDIDALCMQIAEEINGLEKDHATGKLNCSQFKAGLQPLRVLLSFLEDSPKFSPQMLNRQHILELVK